ARPVGLPLPSPVSHGSGHVSGGTCRALVDRGGEVMMPRATLALLCGVLGFLAGSFALGAEPQESAHVPPDPPQHPMGDMPYPQMAAMMQMDDKGRTGMVLFDQLEWRNTTEGNAAVWDAEG